MQLFDEFLNTVPMKSFYMNKQEKLIVYQLRLSGNMQLGLVQKHRDIGVIILILLVLMLMFMTISQTKIMVYHGQFITVLTATMTAGSGWSGF
jgi:hypothetical protein